jgi:hypothetical protein
VPIRLFGGHSQVWPPIRAAFHLTPTSAPWLNAVKGFFAKLTRRRVKRGIFHSLIDLLTAINRNLAEYNHNPNSFVWTSNPDHIIAPRFADTKW